MRHHRTRSKRQNIKQNKKVFFAFYTNIKLSIDGITLQTSFVNPFGPITGLGFGF